MKANNVILFHGRTPYGLKGSELACYLRGKGDGATDERNAIIDYLERDEIPYGSPEGRSRATSIRDSVAARKAGGAS